MDEPVIDLVFPREDRHLQGIQGQAGPQVVSDLPTGDHAGEQAGDEGRVREPAGRVHVSVMRRCA
jgi:hypothetical protein